LAAERKALGRVGKEIKGGVGTRTAEVDLYVTESIKGEMVAKGERIQEAVEIILKWKVTVQRNVGSLTAKYV